MLSCLHGVWQPIMARWVALWLEANHVSGLGSEHAEAYLNSDGTSLIGHVWDRWVEDKASEAEAAEAAMSTPRPPLQPGKENAERALRRLYVYVEGRLTSKAMQLLNIAAEWHVPNGTNAGHRHLPIDALRKATHCDTFECSRWQAAHLPATHASKDRPRLLWVTLSRGV